MAHANHAKEFPPYLLNKRWNNPISIDQAPSNGPPLMPESHVVVFKTSGDLNWLFVEIGLKIGSLSHCFKQLCRTANRFLPLPCIFRLAAPQHLGFFRAEPRPIFISTIRLPPRAESSIQGD